MTIILIDHRGSFQAGLHQTRTFINRRRYVAEVDPPICGAIRVCCDAAKWFEWFSHLHSPVG
jgi:hypothetical protein